MTSEQSPKQGEPEDREAQQEEEGYIDPRFPHLRFRLPRPGHSLVIFLGRKTPAKRPKRTPPLDADSRR